MQGFNVFIYIQISCTLIHATNANFEFDYSATNENSCHSFKDRFQFITETTISRCVEECAARKHCLALNFWSRINICELFSTSIEERSIRGDCIYVKKLDIRVTKTPCQTECKYGKVCVQNKSGLGDCKVKECIKPVSVMNGVVLGNRREVGAKIRFKCNYGYRSQDYMEAVCLDTGVFSYTAVCRPNPGVMLEPDFVSPWHEVIAQKNMKEITLSVLHGLGETPLLVDVQVKVDTSENAGFIFQGTGCPPRDNDEREQFGGIAYIYNKKYVQVSTPTATKDTLGHCVYTGFSPYWDGPYSTSSFSAAVRVRAWKRSTLPVPNFSATGIPIKAGQRADSYVEKEHGINGYPAFVISRTRFPDYDGYYSDSVGAAPVMYINGRYRQNGYVISGFNESIIRAWAPSNLGDVLFSGHDGWRLGTESRGELEFYAWDKKSLSPARRGSINLGPSVSGSSLQQNFANVNVDNTFTRAWVQASNGHNKGFRFIGSGSLAYEKTKHDDVCTYGGLLYAYNESSIRYWQPGAGDGVSNGALICIPSSMGNGVHVQGSSTGKAIYSTWTLVKN